MTDHAVLETSIPGLPQRRGKVRDVYDLGDRLLIVATDRISAFDWVMPNGIPGKGRLLTRISNAWFDRLDVANHLLDESLDGIELPAGSHRPDFEGRTVVAWKADVVPVECVVRGYLSGSGWTQYREGGEVCGVTLPSGLVESDRLPDPIFTPTTKANEGHDLPMTFDEVVATVGGDLAEELRATSLQLYRTAAEYAESRGLILADTKFEFGHRNGELLLVDEALTPDSSRYWPGDEYEPGRGQASFDKQFVRDHLRGTDWDRNSPPPELPDEIVARTREKYEQAWARLFGE